MRYLKDTGFVIKRTNIGEYDRYVTIFSQQHGKIELLAKGVRKISSRRLSYLELLNNIRFQAVKGSKNYILTEVEIVNSYENLRQNLSNCKKLFSICELIENLCPFNQVSFSVYALLTNTLAELQSEIQDNPINFQVQLLTQLGYWDDSREFKSEDDITQYIESIIERRLKTNTYFNVT